MAALRGSYDKSKGLVRLRFASGGGFRPECFACAGSQKTCVRRSKFAKRLSGKFCISYWEAAVKVWLDDFFFWRFCIGRLTSRWSQGLFLKKPFIFNFLIWDFNQRKFRNLTSDYTESCC